MTEDLDNPEKMASLHASDATWVPDSRFRPISEYVVDADGWGPSVVVEVPPSPEFPYHPTCFVARIEPVVGWTARDPGEPTTWTYLVADPIRFMPLPEGAQ